MAESQSEKENFGSGSDDEDIAEEFEVISKAITT